MQAPEPADRARSPLRLEDILAEVQEDLVSVESFLRDRIDSNVELIEKTARYIQQSGGKRIRPSLLLLAARLCGYEGPRARDYAAVMEFIHTATLVHDDIVDEATLRRGRTSINSLLGNHVTVLLGDYLYVRSMGLAIDLGDLEILKVICEVTLRMIEGELLELTRGGDLSISEEEHLDILKRKTAYLFSGCARIGALLGRAEPELEASLSDYGLNLGMAFQVVDDLLDFTGDERLLGKPVLSDLKEGHVTLPVLYLLRAEPSAAGIIQEILDRRSLDDRQRREILDLVRRHRVLDAARRVGESYVLKAQQALAPVPDSAQKESLQALVEYVLERDR
jgi:octaprenyl-diphosphate synthase